MTSQLDFFFRSTCRSIVPPKIAAGNLPNIPIGYRSWTLNNEYLNGSRGYGFAIDIRLPWCP